MHTDQTRYDIPAPTESHSAFPATTGVVDDRQPIELAPASHRSRPLLAVAIVVAAAILTFLGARTVADLGDAAPVADESVELDDEFAGASPDTSIPAGEPAADSPVNDAPDPVGPAPVPEQEDESGDDGVDPDPAHPCDLLAPGQVLAVTPGPVQLPVGTYAGELIITNCGEGPVAWSAHTLAPSVTLGVAGGILAEGAEVDLQFAVDPSTIVGSAMAFTIHVAEPGFDTAVMVQVTKPMLNPGVVLPNVPLQMGE